MATINFLYRSNKNKAFLIIRLLYRFENTDYVFGANTKFEVSKEYWNNQHKLKRPKNIEISNKQAEVNNEINKIENYIISSFNKFSPEVINKKWLETEIGYYYNPPTENKSEKIPINLVDYFDYYIQHKENYPSVVLIRKINVLKKKVQRLQDFRNKPILIKDVNKQFKKEFADYCEKVKYSRITTQRDFAEIKTICLDARSKGIDTSLELDKLSFPREKTTNIYLTFEELESIKNIESTKLTESLSNARDWLIISCFTGQRVSDFMRFNVNMIRYENVKGIERAFIEFTQKKTNKIMTVLLHPKVIEILEKRNFMFPNPISSQKYNDYIKEVCKLAELNEIITGSKKTEIEPNSKEYRKQTGTFEKWNLVSSHIGRRSYATNFYGTIPDTFLMNVTGHTTQQMFLAYVGKSNKDIAVGIADYY